ncbi:MAG TPA: helix-turn-helix domain-containing protein, partial [Longimicrobium sp.]|nr:helix-turn-helix domain-containing protein [Longimicrobium sp.]
MSITERVETSCETGGETSRNRCPVVAAVDRIGGKWKPIIIHYLLERTHRFGELRRRIPSATQQMLTLQLREMERDGLVHREVYREVPPRVEYSLTPLGRRLEPLLQEMIRWGEVYLDETAA